VPEQAITPRVLVSVAGESPHVGRLHRRSNSIRFYVTEYRLRTPAGLAPRRAAFRDSHQDFIARSRSHAITPPYTRYRKTRGIDRPRAAHNLFARPRGALESAHALSLQKALRYSMTFRPGRWSSSIDLREGDKCFDIVWLGCCIESICSMRGFARAEVKRARRS
jgi:hypothetical protein